MKQRPEGYADLAAMSEDERIAMIGHVVTEHGKTVAMMIDDQPEKIARYLRKMRERFPGVAVLDQTPGPVANVVTVRFDPQ